MPSNSLLEKNSIFKLQSNYDNTSLDYFDAFQNKIFTEIQKQPGENNKEQVSSDEYIIVTKTTYNNSYRTTKRLYQTGKIEEVIIKEEATFAENEKEQLFSLGNITEDELATINEVLESLSNEPFIKENFSESYGISIRLNEKDKILYSAEYFNQEDINNIISKY